MARTAMSAIPVAPVAAIHLARQRYGQLTVALLIFVCFTPHVVGQFRDVTAVRTPGDTSPPSKARAEPQAEPPEPDISKLKPTEAKFEAPKSLADYTPPPMSVLETLSEPEGGSSQPHPAIDQEKQQFTIDQLDGMLVDDGRSSKAAQADFGIRGLRFRGLMVGESTLDELLEKWGKPYKVVKSPDSRIIKYRVDPFRQIDVTVMKGTVVSILVYLNDILEPRHVSEQLLLDHLEPVPIPDEVGRVIGLAFPERGVLFSFDTRYPELLVSKIQLEQVNPEPFLMRAEYDFDRRYEQNLKDIATAVSMSPKYARAHWLRAEKMAEIGRYQEALDAADKATHYEPNNAHFQLTRARVMARTGNHDAAVRAVERVLQLPDLPPELEGLAELLHGDLLAEEAGGFYKEAMEHHLKAIELVAPLANEPIFVVRRLAKDILINAHLSVARDISLGDFQNQTEVVRKWLKRAFALVDESASRDQGDAAYVLDVFRQTLATAADLRSEEPSTELIENLLEEAKQQIAAAPDDRGKSRLEWKLGAALAEAVRLERIHGNHKVALDLADDALVLLQKSAKERQSTPDQRYLVGRLYFHVGSLHAVQRDDHEEAIAWYKKAEPLLSGEIPTGVLADPGTHGEMFVSMGVSYWKTNKFQQAIDLTEMGTDILQRAVVDGTLDPVSLSIPYGNLSTMHKDSGNVEDAKAFAELARAIKDQVTQ